MCNAQRSENEVMTAIILIGALGFDTACTPTTVAVTLFHQATVSVHTYSSRHNIIIISQWPIPSTVAHHLQSGPLPAKWPIAQKYRKHNITDTHVLLINGHGRMAVTLPKECSQLINKLATQTQFSGCIQL